MRYFLALCEQQSCTRAAKRCRVAQPSLTRAIKLLEEEFGGQLFHRSRAGIALTELGALAEPDLNLLTRCAAKAKRKASDFRARSTNCPTNPRRMSCESSP